MKRSLFAAILGLAAGALAGFAPASAAPDSPRIFAEIAAVEQGIGTAMAKGDFASLWVLRRLLNASVLRADMSDVKPDEADADCMELRQVLANVASAAMIAMAADTVKSPDADEARAATRADADAAIGAFLGRRAACAKAAQSTLPAVLSRPIGAKLASGTVAVAKLDAAGQIAGMRIAFGFIQDAETQLVDAVSGKPALSQDPAFGKGVAALFAFGKAQAAIPAGLPLLLPCRRLSGSIFQLYDMAAASLDLRAAQGARLDPSRWADAVASFDSARLDVIPRKRACAEAIGLPGAADLIIPEKLLDTVKKP